MFKKNVFKIGKSKFIGFKIRLSNANFVLITAKKGYVMCGYLNLKVSDKLGEAACIVKGVSSPKDMLLKRIEHLSNKARLLGISKGMPVKEALIKLS